MRIDATSSKNKIPYPILESEFEVQSFLFEGLKELGFDVRGEVVALYPDGGRKKKCRFDLVIFENQLPKIIIETKARPVNHKTTVTDTRQGSRYPTFGVPVFFVYGMIDAKQFLQDYKR